MKLPCGESADSQQIREKLTVYSLNFQHADGQHKARLFQAKLGITLDNQAILVAAICEAAAKLDTLALREVDQYGERYTLIFHLVTEAGESDVLTAWILHRGASFPRLTTAYPMRSHRQ
jgi:hypothetical protein